MKNQSVAGEGVKVSIFVMVFRDRWVTFGVRGRGLSNY